MKLKFFILISWGTFGVRVDIYQGKENRPGSFLDWFKDHSLRLGRFWTRVLDLTWCDLGVLWHSPNNQHGPLQSGIFRHDFFWCQWCPSNKGTLRPGLWSPHVDPVSPTLCSTLSLFPWSSYFGVRAFSFSVKTKRQILIWQETGDFSIKTSGLSYVNVITDNEVQQDLKLW